MGSREMTPFEIAWSIIQHSRYANPDNDWISVSIARIHLEAMLDEHRHLREDQVVADARIRELEAALERASYVAENLHGMIDRDTWRASGGDDMQGHYEGDHHAARVREEISEWKGLARTRSVPS